MIPNWHSEDFSRVIWNGKEYTFRPESQRRIIAMLWWQWEAGVFCLHECLVATMCGWDWVDSRLSFPFRHTGVMHEAWGQMIVHIKDGLYALKSYTGRSPCRDPLEIRHKSLHFAGNAFNHIYVSLTTPRARGPKKKTALYTGGRFLRTALPTAESNVEATRRK